MSILGLGRSGGLQQNDKQAEHTGGKEWEEEPGSVGSAGVTAELHADFVARFTEFWRAPDPATLPRVLSDDVHLEAPATPTTDGMAAAKDVFANLLALLPDLHADVHRWGSHDDGVFIEFTLRATVGDGAVAIPAVDVFLVGDDGLGTQRISYFDPRPLLG